MSSIQFVDLKNLISTIETGKRPKGGATSQGIASLGGEHISWDGTFKIEKLKFVPLDYFNSLRQGKIEKKDILVVKDGATTGKVAYVDEDFPLKTACVNEHIFIIRTKNELLPKFLFYYLFSSEGQRKIMLDFRGATVGGITKQFIDFKIPLPSLEEQKRIVAVLDRVQALIKKRNEAIAKLDALVQSVFLDMFGDPVKNNRTWNVQVIGSVVNEIISGWSVGGEEREKKEGEIGVLKISAVTSGEFDSTKYKVIDKGIELKKVLVPKQGDVLFSRANTRELVGACCIVDKDYLDLILPDKLWKIELDSKLVNSIYFKHIMSSEGIRNEISKNATGTSGSMLNISMQKFRNILIPVPPIEIQNEFLIIINKIEQEKQIMKQSLSQLEVTFQSLLQQAFKGELKVNTEIPA